MSAGGGSGSTTRNGTGGGSGSGSATLPGNGSGSGTGSGTATNPDYVAGVSQFTDTTSAQQTGLSLGAALLNLSIEEGRPQGAGLGLIARQDRRISVLESDVSKLKQS